MKTKILLLVGMVLTSASMFAQGSDDDYMNPYYDFIYQDIGYHITDSVKRTVETVYLQTPLIPSELTTGETSPLQTPPLPRKVSFNGRDVSVPQEVEHNGVKYTVTAIGRWSFTYPSYENINVLTLPPTIKKIGDEAFISSRAAKKIVLTGKERIDFGHFIIHRAFVKELDLSDGVEELYAGALGHNRSTKKVKIGAGLHSIGNNCFSALDSLETFELSPDNPYLLLHHGVLFNHDKTRLMAAPAGLKGSFEIPEGTVEVDSSACSSCNLSYFKYPSTLRKIGYMAFSSSSVKKAELPEGLEYIGKRAFDYAGSLEELTIPSTVRFIGEGAFKECTSLKAVHCRRAEPLDIADNTFWKVDLNNCVLYVPKGSADAYRNAPVWQQFRRIKEETAGIDDIAADAVQSVKYVNLAGMESDKPFAGLNIVVTTLADGSRRTAKQRF